MVIKYYYCKKCKVKFRSYMGLFNRETTISTQCNKCKDNIKRKDITELTYEQFKDERWIDNGINETDL